MKVFVRNSSGEEILYLDKQCIPDFVFNQPDPNFVCDLKNTRAYNGQLHFKVLYQDAPHVFDCAVNQCLGVCPATKLETT